MYALSKLEAVIHRNGNATSGLETLTPLKALFARFFKQFHIIEPLTLGQA